MGYPTLAVGPGGDCDQGYDLTSLGAVLGEVPDQISQHHFCHAANCMEEWLE